MKTIFLRAIESDDKAVALRAAAREPESIGGRRFEVDVASFATVPRSPFCYWVSDQLRRLFRELPRFEAEGRAARRGPSSGDDFRYIRCWWEVNRAISHGLGLWKPFAKGGKFSPYYADVHLVIDWEPRRRTFLGFLGRPGREIERPESLDFFFRPGLTWSIKNRFSLKPWPLPEGCVFAHVGPSAFVEDNSSERLAALQAVMSSDTFTCLLRIMAGWNFEVGLIQRTPVPHLSRTEQSVLGTLARTAWSLKRSLATTDESSHAFVLPALLQASGDTLSARVAIWTHHIGTAEAKLAAIQNEINKRCFDLYGIDEDDRRSITGSFGSEIISPESPEEADDQDNVDPDDDNTDDHADEAVLAAELVSWAVGAAFGRFDVRLATGARPLPTEPELFDPLPVCSPGMLTGDDALPLHRPPAGYPLAFPENGVLVDDPGHAKDITASARAVFEVVFGPDADCWWSDAAAVLDPRGDDLRTWLSGTFFEDCLKRYSKSRRKAPIVWQIAVPSGRYSVWLYAHRINRDSFFQIQNDVVTPKLVLEERQLTSLMQSAGANPTARERKEIATQEAFVEELHVLLEEVKRLAPLWNPMLDDGMVLTMAPLWRLVPQYKPWQKELKSKWDELAVGKYDWAHFAMHLWPERVVPKCRTDRSLAIAHGLEDVFWLEGDDGKWTPRLTPTRSMDELIRERTSIAVKAALKSLLEAPAAHAVGSRGRRRWAPNAADGGAD